MIPTVSHASVPQLATDLLLSSDKLSLANVGRLDTSGDLIPFVGSSEASASTSSSSEGGLVTPLEVYSNASLKLTVLQQRSPVIKSRKGAFVAKLTAWIKQQGFSQVLILSSIDASLRVDDELQTPFVHAVPEKSRSSSTAVLDSLKEHFPAFQLADADEKPPSGGRFSRLPSSTGLATRLLTALSSDEGDAVPVGALLLFAAEGDNRLDAHQLAAKAHGLISSHSQPHGPFAEPNSWKGVYGNAYDQSVYG